MLANTWTEIGHIITCSTWESWCKTSPVLHRQLEDMSTLMYDLWWNAQLKTQYIKAYLVHRCNNVSIRPRPISTEYKILSHNNFTVRANWLLMNLQMLTQDSEYKSSTKDAQLFTVKSCTLYCISQIFQFKVRPSHVYACKENIRMQDH